MLFKLGLTTASFFSWAGLAFAASPPYSIRSQQSCLRTVEIELDGSRMQAYDLRVIQEQKKTAEQLATVDKKNSLVFGIDAGGHAYLNFGGHRLDANPLKITRLKNAQIDFGYILNLTDLPQYVEDKLVSGIANLSILKRELSCIHGACRILKDAGIEIKNRSRLSQVWAPSLFSEIIKNGFIDSKTKSPIHIVTYMATNSTLADIRGQLWGRQMAIMSRELGKAAAAGIALVTVGAFTYLVILGEKDAVADEPAAQATQQPMPH